MHAKSIFLAALAGALALALPARAADFCVGYGPQTPRDITSTAGDNPQSWPLAPPARALNLCNLHTHTNAEHKGPGFAVFAGATAHGGYRCNDTDTLTDAELEPPETNAGAYKDVKPGDTIEVHWVYSSCQVAPGAGLGACLSDACANPTLRVEAQVFLVVNDPDALDFADFAHDGTVVDGVYQPKALPTGTGEPVVFRGSTTGPSFSGATCSPLQVTWSVRPQCAKLDINSLNAWAAKGNVFEETESHGVRQLVTAPSLLAPIK